MLLNCYVSIHFSFVIVLGEPTTRPTALGPEVYVTGRWTHMVTEMTEENLNLSVFYICGVAN
jgi:hypothetical protein